jgi:hypothetical protein
MGANLLRRGKSCGLRFHETCRALLMQIKASHSFGSQTGWNAHYRIKTSKK